MAKAPIADQKDRDAARLERTRNVIVDAGAGTGKTTLLVDRVVELVAPLDDGPQALALSRVAAITFTRRAAGELKIRLRAALLDALSGSKVTKIRRTRLQGAVDALDNAHIGTVHSFSDRLLRMFPAHAHISPDYEIMEDAAALSRELLDELVEGAITDSLADATTTDTATARAPEAAQTVRDYLRSGLLQETKEQEFYSKLGLDALVDDMLRMRDRIVDEPDAPVANMQRVYALVDEACAYLDELTGVTASGKTMQAHLERLKTLAGHGEPSEALREWNRWKLEFKHRKPAYKDCKDDEPIAWEANKWIRDGERGRGKAKEERGSSIVEDIDGVLLGWMGRKLVRLFPVVVDLYDRIKLRHKVVDQVDLLLKLRDMLRDHPREVRAPLQGRFDHILVDEFQDTDPLQAEILLYLCEDGAHASEYSEVEVRPASLTVVGDPKQSIYRFRRADVAMYDEVCGIIRKGPVCDSELKVNFRSRADMLDWLNDGFEGLLGVGEDGAAFDADSGKVFHRALDPGRDPAPATPVRVLPFGTGQKLPADPSRDLEGAALAGYIRHLVGEVREPITDPKTGEMRPIRYGDFAVLAISTQNLWRLTQRLDALRIPHVVRGGNQFLKDPLHRQLLLALRALSDRQDGIAQAALRRTPFFGVDFKQLLAARFEEPDEAVAAMNGRITALRRVRFARPVAQTVRALIEETGFGACIARMPNGPQRLARLDELARALDALAREEGLDFDGITTRARTWLANPAQLEVPLPVDVDAVQVLTVHQAKGLEWPAVALWDGRGSEATFLTQPGFFIDGTTHEWALALNEMKYDPLGSSALAQREKAFRTEERRRVAYVAATRAREMLIVPEAGEVSDKWLYGKLLGAGGPDRSERIDEYKPEDETPDRWWNQMGAVSLAPPPAIQQTSLDAWPSVAEKACTASLSPTGVSTAAHQALRASVEEQPTETGEPAPRKFRKGRYGTTFGSTVHRALELLITKRAKTPEDAVQAAAEMEGLGKNIGPAVDDTRRTWATLKDEGLLDAGVVMRPEYPISGTLPDQNESLYTGYIDLLAMKGDELLVIDFKTDEPPEGDAQESHAEYVAQVRAYMELLKTAGAVPAGGNVRGALLFTADGAMRWTE